MRLVIGEEELKDNEQIVELSNELSNRVHADVARYSDVIGRKIEVTNLDAIELAIANDILLTFLA